MNEFTDKNDQVFRDACDVIGVEPDAMVNTNGERYLVSEFLKNPVPWLETELLYYSHTTREQAQEVATGIDRMISEGGTSWPCMFPRAKAPSDTGFGSSDRASLKPGPG
jgi:hypothetical protein